MLAGAARGETGSKGGGGPVKLSDVYTRHVSDFVAYCFSVHICKKNSIFCQSLKDT